MQKSTSFSFVSLSTLIDFLYARKRVFTGACVMLVLVMFIVPCVLSEMRAHVSKNWSDGWSAWTRGDARTALSCWTQNSLATSLAPRPAKIYYWRIRALEKLGRHSEADVLRKKAAQKYPLDFYTFLLLPDGGASTYRGKISLMLAVWTYPRPWPDDVERAYCITGVPKHTVWAVMKRESKFNADAQSQSGAIGLMQLMPMTARGEARLLGIPATDIFAPKDNILLGARHLAGLNAKFNGEVPRAIAAYNAGASSVIRWGTLGANDWAEWIERIPYAETREFVRSVLENREIYRLLYHEMEISPLFYIALERPSRIREAATYSGMASERKAHVTAERYSGATP